MKPSRLEAKRVSALLDSPMSVRQRLRQDLFGSPSGVQRGAPQWASLQGGLPSWGWDGRLKEGPGGRQPSPKGRMDSPRHTLKLRSPTSHPITPILLHKDRRQSFLQHPDLHPHFSPPCSPPAHATHVAHHSHASVNVLHHGLPAGAVHQPTTPYALGTGPLASRSARARASDVLFAGAAMASSMGRLIQPITQGAGPDGTKGGRGDAARSVVAACGDADGSVARCCGSCRRAPPPQKTAAAPPHPPAVAGAGHSSPVLGLATSPQSRDELSEALVATVHEARTSPKRMTERRPDSARQVRGVAHNLLHPDSCGIKHGAVPLALHGVMHCTAWLRAGAGMLQVWVQAGQTAALGEELQRSRAKQLCICVRAWCCAGPAPAHVCSSKGQCSCHCSARAPCVSVRA